MIKEKRGLVTNRPVLDQIVVAHQINYKQLARELGMSEEGLRKWRSGERGLRLNMSQIKALSKLLEPLGTRLEDLPEDWILEDRKINEQ